MPNHIPSSSAAMFDELASRHPNTAPLLTAIKNMVCFRNGVEEVFLYADEIEQSAATVAETYRDECEAPCFATLAHEKAEMMRDVGSLRPVLL